MRKNEPLRIEGLPIADRRLPIGSSCQLPVASCQGLLIADCRLPIEGSTLGTGNWELGTSSSGLRTQHSALVPQSAIGNRQSAILLCLLVLLLAASPARAQDAGVLLSPKAFRAAVEKIRPSLVTIETYGSTAQPAASRPATPATRPATRPGAARPMPMPLPRPRPRGGGVSQPGEGPTTGLIVSSDGLILTSTYNFLRGQPIITVVLPDQTQHVARLLGRDETRKLCILKIEDVKDLPVPAFVDRARMKVGQWAISVGYGYGGEEPAISSGIISAVHRMGGRAIQTDANLSPANYGGPLIDLDGRVLGICTPMSPQSRDTAGGTEWYDSGIGFAVPLHGLDSLIAKMARGEIIKPGWLGIQPAPQSPPEGGVSVGTVMPDSPAAKSGLQKGDIILRIAGRPVNDAKAMAEIMGTLEAGAEIPIVYRRGSEERTAAVQLGIPPG